MTDMMWAMVLTGHGGMDRLDWRKVARPQPKPHEVLIKVLACGLNNTDVNTRTGWYSKTVSEATKGEAHAAVGQSDPAWGGSPISFPRIQGADVCGRVVACGIKADQDLLGKRVIIDPWLRDWDDPLNREKAGYFGSECDGGFAEYTVIDARNVAAVDGDLSDAELATFSCSYSTAEGMLTRAGAGPGDWVLVTGASGGVGGALVQLARRRGAHVVALASKDKHPEVAKLKPDALLERTPADLRAALQQAIGRETVTIVADIVGGSSFGTLIEVLAGGGTYVCSGAIAGPIVDLDLRSLYLKDLTFMGSTVLAPDIFPELVGYIARGEIRPVLGASYPLKELQRAQEAFIAKKHVGNIVVIP